MPPNCIYEFQDQNNQRNFKLISRRDDEGQQMKHANKTITCSVIISSASRTSWAVFASNSAFNRLLVNNQNLYNEYESLSICFP